ncbi:MAG: DUF5916 domain-containing protein [Mariniphaga sp.]
MICKFSFLSLVLILILHVVTMGVGIPENNSTEVLVILKKDSVANLGTINQNYKIHAKKLEGTIKLDGVINEEDWLKAEKADNFYMVLPLDTGHSAAKSEIVMAYDEKAFYLALVFHDTVPGKRQVESLRRDWVFNNNDNFLFFIDPFNDQTTGYSFGVNAEGAIWDGVMSGGQGSNLIWDCKWETKTKNYPDKWVSEMRIPFKSVRYKNNVNHWNIQFSRLDLKLNEKSAWAPVPRQFPTASLAYAGQVIWDTPPPKSGLKLSLIPYLFGSSSRNFEAGTNSRYHKDFGFDAKVGLSSSLNLDLTYNPDFSQAEVDDQVTNLERFELYFPEKRQFFLENSDLFGNYGTLNIRPFFSRRIGLDAPVRGGARLSGKLGNGWRIGLMDMQTGTEGDYLARNFFVTSIQKKVFSRSNISAIFVNKQQLQIPENWKGNNYNRLIGLEYNLASSNNFWTGKLFALKSFTPKATLAEEFSHGMNLIYSRKTFLFEFTELYVGQDFNAETGYVPRRDFMQFNPKITYKIYPKTGPLEYHGVQTEFSNIYSPNNLKLTDQVINAGYFFQFKSRARIDFKGNYSYVVLRSNFDPTNKGLNPLLSGSNYRWDDFTAMFTSDNRKIVKYDIQAGKGGYFNGKRWFVKGSFNYRFQPYGYISMIYSYNELSWDNSNQKRGFWLVGPKLDVTFTDKLFFTTYVQYNEQVDNLNLNARFQWRYKPVSDLFLVYTDNYFPGEMNVKNRALVLKLSYWFN